MLKNATLARAISCIIATSALGAAEARAQDPSAVEPTELGEVAVTGSRIRHDVYTASQPIDIVVPENAAAQGIGSISALLQTSTVAAGSPQVTAASSTAFVQAGGTGAQTLSLRGLGANRTLVLLNGRRAGPAGVRGEVSSFDFNVLPLGVIERVEILKDGASSIYGSDAVAGVVNVITRKGDGATADGFVSQPSESGGEESRFNVSWGKGFERGNFRITGDYHREDELKQGDRSYFRCGQQFIFDPDSGDRVDVLDPRTGKPACRDLLWGHVWLYDYQRFFTDDGGQGNVPTRTQTLAQYDYDGDLGNFIPGIAVDPDSPEFLTAPPGWFLVNYDRPTDGVANADHPFQDASSLNPKMERVTIFADGEINLTDNVTAYAEVLLNRRKTTANGYRQFWTYLYNENFNFQNFDMVEDSGDPLSAGWQGAQWLSPTPITDHSGSLIEVDYQRYVAGLRGNLQSDWNWDVSVQKSKSDGEYTSEQIFNDSIQDNWFAFGSCVGTTSSVRGAPCVDIPWLDPQFLAGEVSPEVRDFLFGVETGNTQYDQWSAEAFISGRLFDMPAGPFNVAFGVHYQEDEIRDVPGEITLAENVWGASSAGITAGDDTTKAVFAEVEVPLLRDKPLVESLTLTASGRYTDVESYGNGDTYKVGLNWAITPSLRLRASQGTSFRTPALFELFLADQTGFLSQRAIDPCIGWGTALAAGNISQTIADNCAADGIAEDFAGAAISATIISGGGFGLLKAETSESQSVGLVWRPQFADLSVSVDYFDIEVNDEVAQFGPGNIVFNCYDSDFFPTDPLCDLFERDPSLDNIIATVRDNFINIAKQTNRGFDVAALYRTTLPWGSLTIETQHTFQEDDVRAFFAQTPEDLNGLVGHPDWVGRLNLTFDREQWSYFWGVNFIGSSSNHGEFGGNTATYRGEPVRVVLRTDTVVYHAASVTREFEDWGLTARLGVANLFDEEPPRVTTLNLGEVNTIGNSAFYSQYDWLGRRYFLNLTKAF
ncbi:MAG TPA: TonB-dependent receptor [Vicinamibacterales bacterium]|nr:TonB-dependent receptor [Vicinamibacterales bacterium]